MSINLELYNPLQGVEGDRQSRYRAAENPGYGTVGTRVNQLTLTRQVRVFVRDGFIDRYSGEQLIYPGALLLLKQMRPRFFGSMSGELETGPIVKTSELTPKLARIVPLHLGGTNSEENLLTTSELRYTRRGIRTAEQLGWEVYPEGNMSVWDGMMGWFLRMMETSSEQGLDREDPELCKWYAVAKSGVWIA